MGYHWVRVSDGSIIGQYARIRVDQGDAPLRSGLTFACRVTGLLNPNRSDPRSVLRGEVVSTDVDGPLPADLIGSLLIITPRDAHASEARILEGESFRARLGVVSASGEQIAAGEGSLVRVSREIPFERMCPACQGWKICEDCGGTGGDSIECAYCRGTGACVRCSGTGSVTEAE